MIKFLDEVYKHHPKLCTLMLIMMLGVVLFGGLTIVDTIQKEQRDKNSYTVDLDEYDEIPAFNVDGMTDEEIEKSLEEYRNNKKGADD